MATVTRAQKLRLGLFVAAALLALGTALVLLVGRSMLQVTDEYVVRFSSREVSFSGLEVGSPVKYSGINIGQVRSIRICPDDVSVVEVFVSVDGGTPIAEDSIASLASQGITGLKYVELSRGSPNARVREPGEEIPAGDSLFDALSTKAGSIAERLDDLLSSLQEIADADAKENVDRMLDETAGILEDNRPHISEILGNVRLITADLARFSNTGVSVAGKTDEFMDRMNEVGGSLHHALSDEGKLMQALQQTEQLIERLNMLVLRSENDLDVALRHLREATTNLNDFSLVIRDDPRALIGGRDWGGGRDSGYRGDGQ
ncbi:MAG: MlaD family protein [Myxococcota bacterium]